MERGNGGSPYRENTVRDIISSGKLPSLVSRGGTIFRHGDVRNASYCLRLMTRDVKRRFEVPPGFHRNVDAFASKTFNHARRGRRDAMRG